jgi:hypothetical protein
VLLGYIIANFSSPDVLPAGANAFNVTAALPHVTQNNLKYQANALL